VDGGGGGRERRKWDFTRLYTCLAISFIVKINSEKREERVHTIDNHGPSPSSPSSTFKKEGLPASCLPSADAVLSTNVKP
jgi:hypothetical protein